MTQACDPLSLAPRGVCVCVCVCVCVRVRVARGQVSGDLRLWIPGEQARAGEAGQVRHLAAAAWQGLWSATPSQPPALRIHAPPLSSAPVSRAASFFLPARACYTAASLTRARCCSRRSPPHVCVCVCVCARARARISQGAICEKMRGYLRLECSECNKFFTSEADRLRHTVCRPPCPCLSCVALRPCPHARESACLHGRDVSLSPPPILLPARP